jgi:TyrR family helix-turn-helix protein
MTAAFWRLISKDEYLMDGLGIRVEQSTPPKRALKEGGSLTDEISTVEKQILEKALAQCKTTRELARQLGISQPTVVRKLKKYALSLPYSSS